MIIIIYSDIKTRMCTIHSIIYDEIQKAQLYNLFICMEKDWLTILYSRIQCLLVKFLKWRVGHIRDF